MRGLLKYLSFVVLFLMFNNVIKAQQPYEHCIIKVESKWGATFDGCGTTESYSVYLKDTCNNKMDVVVAVLEKSGEWKVYAKSGMGLNDTIIGFACEGVGKFQHFYKLSGTPKKLETYEDLNKIFISKKGNKNEPTKKDENLIDLAAKILKGSKTMEPLANQEVVLTDNKGIVLQKSITDVYGDFRFLKIDTSSNYAISIPKPNKKVAAGEQIFLAKPNGIIIKAFKIEQSGFKFELLPADLSSLTRMEDVEDPVLKVEEFKKSNAKEIIVSENIYYQSGAWKVDDQIKKDLDIIVGILKKNNNLIIEVSSYTDSPGDDKLNLEISQKRASEVTLYISGKGIENTRLKAIGKGESKILNRCLNNVNCSEKEHQLNRRTEFKFIKK